MKSYPGKYRLLNLVGKLNRVTVKDANLALSTNLFSEEFAGFAIFSLVDFFSGYNQVELDEESRDFTAFMTSLGLMRMTTLPQNATNSVAHFIRIVLKILSPHLQDRGESFLEDVGVKRSKSRLNTEEMAPRIRRSFLKNMQSWDKVLASLE